MNFHFFAKASVDDSQQHNTSDIENNMKLSPFPPSVFVFCTFFLQFFYIFCVILAWPKKSTIHSECKINNFPVIKMLQNLYSMHSNWHELLWHVGIVLRQKMCNIFLDKARVLLIVSHCSISFQFLLRWVRLMYLHWKCVAFVCFVCKKRP